jgi:hypothetical protein
MEKLGYPVSINLSKASDIFKKDCSAKINRRSLTEINCSFKNKVFI